MSDRTRYMAADQIILLVGRLLIANIFLHEAIAKISNYAGAAAYARSFGVPDTLLPLAIALELGCGLAIAMGLWTRPAALLLSGFCIFTAVAFHTHFAERNQLLHFEKNLAMAGGLLVLAAHGAGRITVCRPVARVRGKPNIIKNPRKQLLS
jgi:putative oxidoreductase